MKIYISGISGTGMGSLALMAKAAGITVYGSDLSEGAIYPELLKADIEVKTGKQDGEFLQEKLVDGVEWFIYTSALPEDHAELLIAKKAGIRVTKRDELTAFLVEKLGLKMVAVAGTHGKTTTTAMIIWASLKLGLPVSYIVGTTLGFAKSGSYRKGDKYFIYEADEYDKNFLKFHPWLTVVTSVSYDHPDIYATREEYKEAFREFEAQSEKVIDQCDFEDFRLAGKVRRRDAGLASEAIRMMAPEIEMDKIVAVMNEFPGVGRRFERLVDGIYTDYAHHPEEVVATIDVARDEAKIKGLKKVVVVYQPHQNTRQCEVRDGYEVAFEGADKVYWLPTYLTRENPAFEILTPEDLISGLKNRGIAEVAELDDELLDKIMGHRNGGDLVVLMTAGPADGWLRKKLNI